MRFVTYFSKAGSGGPVVGYIEGDTIMPLQVAGAPTTMLELISQYPDGRYQLPREQLIAAESGVKRDAVKLLAPIPRPAKNVFCVGRNYVEHVSEGAAARGTDDKPPEIPVFFTKAPTCVIGPDDAITFDPTLSTQIDWEAELAVVIGRRGTNISYDHALDYVFGYTCLNDVTARDLQRSHNQWFKGKSLDTFCPIGPEIVTADEIGDPQNLNIQLRVNGEVKQSSNTKMMIFGVRRIIAELSRGLTLEPGDIIATGTPSGTGFALNPPQFLKHDDIVEIEIERIGLLRNTVQEIK